jgi:dTDP-glucose 4,6-dehydratase
VVVDKLTYAGHLETLAEVAKHPRYAFVQADIADQEAVRGLFREHAPATVVNFAAETHVDRSIDDPADFVRTNVAGTFELLEAARQHLRETPEAAGAFRLLHVSTDEVYGTLGSDGAFSETTPYAPNSPYAASKAAADHFVRAYHETYRLPVLLTNCSNNYGPYQFPEKVIPLFTTNLLDGKQVPLYGDGLNVRDWIHVEDHNIAAHLVLEQGVPGEIYNIGAGNEVTNVELTHRLLELTGRDESFIRPVEDRLGHDRRYSVNIDKVSALGWSLSRTFDDSLAATVEWYRDHRDWWEPLKAKAGL